MINGMSLPSTLNKIRFWRAHFDLVEWVGNWNVMEYQDLTTIIRMRSFIEKLDIFKLLVIRAEFFLMRFAHAFYRELFYQVQSDTNRSYIGTNWTNVVLPKIKLTPGEAIGCPSKLYCIDTNCTNTVPLDVKLVSTEPQLGTSQN